LETEVEEAGKRITVDRKRGVISKETNTDTISAIIDTTISGFLLTYIKRSRLVVLKFKSGSAGFFIVNFF
jgi:hypothetical protein